MSAPALSERRYSIANDPFRQVRPLRCSGLIEWNGDTTKGMRSRAPFGLVTLISTEVVSRTGCLPIEIVRHPSDKPTAPINTDDSNFRRFHNDTQLDKITAFIGAAINRACGQTCIAQAEHFNASGELIIRLNISGIQRLRHSRRNRQCEEGRRRCPFRSRIDTHVGTPTTIAAKVNLR
jgi:hypothetical protein